MTRNQSINLIILLILIIIFVIRSKEKKLTILFLFIMFVVYWIYYLVGYWFHTDMPIAFYFSKNGSSISFLGCILLIVTSFFAMAGAAKLFGLGKK